MTRAKDISKIVTDADLSGTLDVTGTVTAGGLTVDGSVNVNTSGAGVITAGSDTSYFGVYPSGTYSAQFYLNGENRTGFESVAMLGSKSFQVKNHILNKNIATFDGTTGDISFYEDTGTTPKLFWDASAERLGIGTVSPSTTLHLDSGGTPTTIQIDSDTEASIDFNDHGGSPKRYKIGTNISSNDGQLEFKDMTANAERMRIDSSGNVGIGSSPTAKFSVYSGASGVVARIDGPNAYNAESGLEFSVGRARISGVLESSGGTPGAYLKFMTMPNGGSVTERMRIDSSGNVGIGTSSPAEKINIVGTGGTAKIRFDGDSSNLQNNFIGITGYDDFIIASDEANSATASTIQFRVDATEAMRIDSSGNLLVGTTTNGTTATGTVVRSTGEVLITRSGGGPLLLNRTSDGGTILEFRKDNTSEGVIAVADNILKIFATKSTANCGLGFFSNNTIRPLGNNGAEADDEVDMGDASTRFDDIRATNGTIQTSDQNEKNTITDSDLGIDFIKRLTPKSYIFNGKTRTHYGLIAQDVETVLTDISKPTSGFAGFIKDDISEEQDGSQYRYGLRYTEFVAPLIQAVKDQQATIDALTARITALENGE